MFVILNPTSRSSAGDLLAYPEQSESSHTQLCRGTALNDLMVSPLTSQRFEQVINIYEQLLKMIK